MPRLKAYHVTVSWPTSPEGARRRTNWCTLWITAYSRAQAAQQAYNDYPANLGFTVNGVTRDSMNDWRIEYTTIWEPLWRAATANCPKPRDKKASRVLALRLCLGFKDAPALQRALKRIPNSALQKKRLRAFAGPNGRIMMKLRLTELKKAQQFDWENRM